jgi:four helix bundle protein
VWQKAHRATLIAIEIVNALPLKPGIARFADQLVGAVSSIAANIAEGHGDYSGKEFPRYLRIALASAHETDNWVQVFKDSTTLKGFVSREELNELEGLNIEVIRMLNTLIKRIEAKRRGDG